MLVRDHQQAAEHDSDRMQPERERGDHAEVPASAAQRPEQLGVLGRARRGERSVSGHQLRREQVVAREPVLAREPADPAAEREAADAGRRDQPAGRAQAVGLRRGVHLGPARAALHARGARDRVDLDAAHAREVDHEAAVARALAGDVVSAAADRGQQPLAAGEAHGLDHIGGARAAGDQRGPAVDRPVPDAARAVVVRVAGCDHVARQRPLELLDRPAVEECVEGRHGRRRYARRLAPT